MRVGASRARPGGRDRGDPALGSGRTGGHCVPLAVCAPAGLLDLGISVEVYVFPLNVILA
eukprot:scaffold201516_cov39-Prasinocladus_malaysianus.AAC.1